MTKIDLKQRFSIKSAFSWRSAPCRMARIDRRSGLGLGPRHGFGPDQARPCSGQNIELGLAKNWDKLNHFFSMKRSFILIFSMKGIFSY